MNLFKSVKSVKGALLDNRSVLDHKRQVQHLEKNASISNSLSEWNNYTNFGKFYDRLIKKTICNDYYLKIQENNPDIKATWKVLTKLINKSSNLIIIIKKSKPDDILDEFNKYFVDLGSNLSKNILIAKNSSESYINISENHSLLHEIPSQEVLQHLLALSSNKAVELDKIPFKLIKIAAPILAKSLTPIFNKSMTTGIFPNEWKIL